MKYEMFAVRDSKAGVFMTPNLYQTKGVARRAFTDAVNDPNTPFSKHPDDYALFALGTYCEESGRFESLPQPENLGLASEYIQSNTGKVSSISKSAH